MDKEKIRVLFVIRDLFSVGGAERVVIDQINNLDKDIFDCFLCVLGGDMKKPLTELVNIDLKKTKKIPFESLLDIRSWIDFIRWLRTEGFDIIYSHLFFANFVGRISGKLVGIKKIISVEHNVYLDHSFIQRFVNFLLSFITHKIIAVSGSVKNYLMNKELIRSSKIEVVYNGVDLKRYFFNNDARNEIRKNFDLGERGGVIISVGRVTEQKGYDVLLSVANEIINNRKFPICFWIVGPNNDDFGKKMKKRVSDYHLSGYVHFLGSRDDVPDLLSAADMFFMPSKWEGFGLVLIEAMANGKPAVVSNIDTLKEIVGDNNDFGLTGNNEKEFADILIKLESDKLFYEKYEKLSLKRASNFNLERNIKGISNLFLES